MRVESAKTAVTDRRYSEVIRGTRAATGFKISKVREFQLTRGASLLVCESRETAGLVLSAEPVFFSGPASQFSAVDDCLRLGFVVYAKDDL